MLWLFLLLLKLILNFAYYDKDSESGVEWFFYRDTDYDRHHKFVR